MFPRSPRLPRAAARAAATGTAFLLAAGCAAPADELHGTALSVATMSPPQSLDPAEAIGSTLPYFQAVYDTLLLREPDGSYSPMLATGWEWDEARTELTLTLRDDVVFDSGEPFDAAAVKANMERFRDAGGAQAATLAGLERVEVASDSTAVVHLAAPEPAFEYFLSDAAGLMADPAAFAAEEGRTLATAPQGSGPYELDAGRTAPGTRWTFTRSDDYWGAELPYDEIAISYFDNEQAIVNGLRTGQVNAALLQSAEQQQSIVGDAVLRTTSQTIDMQSLLLFDRDGAMVPELADHRVRQAIAHALDRPAMLEFLRLGRGEITDQVAAPGSAGYVPELDERYPYDPGEARRLLAEAGYSDGFTLPLPRMAEIVPDAMAASISTDLAAVGIEVAWEELEGATALQEIFVEQRFPAMVMNNAQMDPYWITLSELVLPGTFNFLGTADDTSAELLGRLRATPEEDPAGAETARELTRHLVEQAWFVPFYRMEFEHVSDGTVQIEPQSGMAVPSIYNYTPVGG